MEWQIRAKSPAKALYEPYKIVILDTPVKQSM